MSRLISLLCVHGVAHSEIDPDFRQSWTEAIVRSLQRCDLDATPVIDFLEYDALFDKAPINSLLYGVAFARLLASSVVHGIGDMLERRRGIEDLPEIIRWTAGMVAQWTTDDELRQSLRSLLLEKLGVPQGRARKRISSGPLSRR